MYQTKLGARLKAARLARRFSLRDIEARSDRGITNSYLCRIEKGTVEEVSPRILRLLAELLKLDYMELMILAGYLTVHDLKGRV